MEKLFSEEPEPVTRDLRAFIEDWGKSLMKNPDQISRTRFLGEYDGLYLYDIDIERIYIIDYEKIHFVNKYGYALIGNPENPCGTSTDHEYFLIHDDLFDRIL